MCAYASMHRYAYENNMGSDELFIFALNISI